MLLYERYKCLDNIVYYENKYGTISVFDTDDHQVVNRCIQEMDIFPK